MFNIKKWGFLQYVMAFIFLSMIVSLVLTIISWGNATTPTEKSAELFLIIEIIAGTIVLLLPLILEKLFKFKFPTILVTLFLVFVYCAIYLGTIYHFYSIPYWDKFLHLMSAMMLGGLGYAIFGALVKKDTLDTISPFLLSFFAFCFGLSMGVFWEFYEYTFDGLLGLDMQRFMSNAGELYKGRAALLDTMTDLIADALGAFAIAVIGYFGIKGNRQWINKFLFTSTKNK